MDTVRPTNSASRRTGSLLALALAASAVLSPALTPALASGPSAGAGTSPLVEVVVSSTGQGAAALQAASDAVRAAGGTVRDALPLIGGVSAELPAGAVLAPAFTVVDNAPITLASKKVAADRDATAVREALGLGVAAGQGAGVLIAVVDTGVADVPDLAGRVTHVDVSGSWSAGELRDAYGHGTFVAGVAAGDGSSSAGSRYAGVAPGASVLDVRVADERGETDLATVLAGLQAASDAGADVVNLSMSSGSPLPHQIDPLTVALSNLWRAGTVVVVPTGNDGPDKGSVTSPGSDPTLLTVGALDERASADRSDDVVPDFSGRGPAPQHVDKPELVAPGTSLVSLRAPGSVVDLGNPGSTLDGTYFRGSGTSFATAAVAGAAAVLLQGRPELAPDQVKSLVRETAYSAKGLRNVRDAGAGGLDLSAALAAPAPTTVGAEDEAPPPGDEQAWTAFLQALMDGDRAAAAAAWSDLSPAAHKWAAHTWASESFAAHKWGAHKWGAHKWAGSDVSAEQWELRLWAGHKWAAHKWASDEFVAHKWAGHKWAGHKWADDDWAGHKWAAHKWAAHKWAAHKWAGSSWS